MLKDMSDIKLIPGDMGRNCPGNGENGEYECFCDECDYMLCCTAQHDVKQCESCDRKECKNNKNIKMSLDEIFRLLQCSQ